MWSKGEYMGYEYWVKHYDEPSEDYGYMKGRMSKIQNSQGRQDHLQLRPRLGH